jgi:hypothetical protein
MRFGLVRNVEGYSDEKIQNEKLKEYGVDEIINPEQNDFIIKNWVEPGDEIIITNLLVLSENGMEIIKNLQMLENKKVSLTILNQ